MSSNGSARQMDTAVLSSTITAKQARNPPFDGRNVVGLVQFVRGINESDLRSLTTGEDFDGHRQSAEMSVNGPSDVWTIRGSMGPTRMSALLERSPHATLVESIPEIQVQTNDYSATVSRTGGGAINVTTRSGTNAFHGSLFEDLRHDVFDAGNFDFWQSWPKNQYHFNQLQLHPSRLSVRSESRLLSRCADWGTAR